MMFGIGALMLDSQVCLNCAVEHVNVKGDARCEPVLVRYMARVTLTANLEVIALLIVTFNRIPVHSVLHRHVPTRCLGALLELMLRSVLA